MIRLRNIWTTENSCTLLHRLYENCSRNDSRCTGASTRSLFERQRVVRGNKLPRFVLQWGNKIGRNERKTVEGEWVLKWGRPGPKIRSPSIPYPRRPISLSRPFIRDRTECNCTYIHGYRGILDRLGDIILFHAPVASPFHRFSNGIPEGAWLRVSPHLDNSPRSATHSGYADSAANFPPSSINDTFHSRIFNIRRILLKTRTGVEYRVALPPYCRPERNVPYEFWHAGTNQPTNQPGTFGPRRIREKTCNIGQHRSEFPLSYRARNSFLYEIMESLEAVL